MHRGQCTPCEAHPSLVAQRVQQVGTWGSFKGAWGLIQGRFGADVQIRPYKVMNSNPKVSRGPKDHINIRISPSASKDQYKGDTRNHGG